MCGSCKSYEVWNGFIMGSCEVKWCEGHDVLCLCHDDLPNIWSMRCDGISFLWYKRWGVVRFDAMPCGDMTWRHDMIIHDKTRCDTKFQTRHDWRKVPAKKARTIWMKCLSSSLSLFAQSFVSKLRSTSSTCQDRWCERAIRMRNDSMANMILWLGHCDRRESRLSNIRLILDVKGNLPSRTMLRASCTSPTFDDF